MFSPKFDDKDLWLENYNFELPKELIAQKPRIPRDECKLLVIFNDGIMHLKFKDIVNFIQKDDVLVLNNTKVIKTKLIGKKSTGGKLSITIIEIKDNNKALAYLHTKNPKPGTEFHILNNEKIISKGKVIDKKGKHFLIELNENISLILEKYGKVTLPPYIKEEIPEEHYQTIYSKEKGSLAAPTAGLHFTKKLLKRIQDKGVKIAYVTLNVGLGTFEPVNAKKITNHKIHEEQFKVDAKNIEIIKNAKRIIVVGTTSLRVLESLNHLEPKIGTTNIFIYPGYKFKHKYYGLITNFHLPKSTLLMLVSAIVGRERIIKIYKKAIKKRYKFFSLGDATFIVDDSLNKFKHLSKDYEYI